MQCAIYPCSRIQLAAGYNIKEDNIMGEFIVSVEISNIFIDGTKGIYTGERSYTIASDFETLESIYKQCFKTMKKHGLLTITIFNVNHN